MTDQNNQEPTMEEILASIRRIISEDDAPGEDGAPVAEAAPPPPAPEPEPAPPPAYEPPEVSAQIEEDVLELTDRVDSAGAAPVESVGDLDVFSSEAPAPEPAPPPPAAAPSPAAYAAPVEEEETLLSAPAAATAAGAFAALSSSIGMPRDGRTLEDVTRELLRPLLKQWLDDNLPRIVETAVQNEVERISRQRGV